ncbi:UNVERIFIED_CONTAM: protein IQ-DOMAIN 20 [Sesamum radiatum]|uniref:Protein IQ-DOMAIN 20 n=2 Tax=Sesamum TaxID=4181 RepID=A0AAW2P6D0_SESRA
MAKNRDMLWWGTIRRKLFRSSPSSHHHDANTIIVLHTNNGNFSQESNSSACQENAGSDFVSRDDIAAITIQACFRGHLARRAYRALRSLVKLQAVVRGVVVRRQARFALHCMHALARLQVTVRARQLLLNN